MLTNLKLLKEKEMKKKKGEEEQAQRCELRQRKKREEEEKAQNRQEGRRMILNKIIAVAIAIFNVFILACNSTTLMQRCTRTLE